jgi:hypothetical protein
VDSRPSWLPRRRAVGGLTVCANPLNEKPAHGVTSSIRILDANEAIDVYVCIFASRLMGAMRECVRVHPQKKGLPIEHCVLFPACSVPGLDPRQLQVARADCGGLAAPVMRV